MKEEHNVMVKKKKGTFSEPLKKKLLKFKLKAQIKNKKQKTNSTASWENKIEVNIPENSVETEEKRKVEKILGHLTYK